jgi:predicted transcriptional regulator
MNENLNRKALFMVNDLETLKTLTDPLRMQILELLDPAPQTVNYVAERLGLAASRLYYHFNLLESIGLIEVVRTRTVNNIIEKYYWVTADEIEINADLMNYSSEVGPANIAQMVSSSLETTRDDFVRTLEARKYNLEHGAKPSVKKVIADREMKRLSDKTYQEFLVKVKKILEEFKDLPEADEGDPESNVFSMACYFYPSYYYENEAEDLDGK